MGYAYCYYSGLSLSKYYENIDIKEKFNPLLSLPGLLLSIFWKFKYRKNKESRY